MKSLVAVALLVLSFNGLAGGREERKVAKLMGGKDLVCNPYKAVGRPDPEYKGDEGYFRLTIDKKWGLTVTDNGGSGYGFANGGFNDLMVSGSKIVFSVGDDGHQTLLFDFYDIGAASEFKDNCGEATLVSFPDGYGGSDELVCCLENRNL